MAYSSKLNHHVSSLFELSTEVVVDKYLSTAPWGLWYIAKIKYLADKAKISPEKPQVYWVLYIWAGDGLLQKPWS